MLNKSLIITSMIIWATFKVTIVNFVTVDSWKTNPSFLDKIAIRIIHSLQMAVFIKTISQRHNEYDIAISIVGVIMYITKSHLENDVFSWDTECQFTMDMLLSDLSRCISKFTGWAVIEELSIRRRLRTFLISWGRKTCVKHCYVDSSSWYQFWFAIICIDMNIITDLSTAIQQI